MRSLAASSSVAPNTPGMSAAFAAGPSDDISCSFSARTICLECQPARSARSPEMVLTAGAEHKHNCSLSCLNINEASIDGSLHVIAMACQCLAKGLERYLNLHATKPQRHQYFLTCEVEQLGEELPGSGLPVNASLGHALDIQHDIAVTVIHALRPLPYSLCHLMQPAPQYLAGQADEAHKCLFTEWISWNDPGNGVLGLGGLDSALEHCDDLVVALHMQSCKWPSLYGQTPDSIIAEDGHTWLSDSPRVPFSCTASSMAAWSKGLSLSRNQRYLRNISSGEKPVERLIERTTPARTHLQVTLLVSKPHCTAEPA